MTTGGQSRRQVGVEIPHDLDATYANFAVITHTPSEMVLDFARVLPNAPSARVHARVVMTMMNAKLLLRALGENLEKFEAQFGEIKLPAEGDSLVQQFFGPNPPPQSPSG